MMSAVSGPIALAMAVNSGSRMFSTRSGEPEWRTMIEGSTCATPNVRPMPHASSAGAGPLHDEDDADREQRAAQEARRHEELQRIFEVGRQCAALALALGLQAARQPHQQAEGHLDDGEEQQSDGRQEYAKRNHRES